MARGSRTYTRDSRGRFASGGGSSGGKSRGGSLSARRSLRQSRSKLATKDPADRSIKGQLSRRSQKGAVTRANKRLIEAQKVSQRRMPTQKKASRISAPAGFKKGMGVKRVGVTETAIQSKTAKIHRTRTQAILAQRDRNQRVYEFSRSAPGRVPIVGERDHSIRIKKYTTNQPNIITGMIDKVVNRTTATTEKSAIGHSRTARKTQKRRDRAEVRYEQLLRERDSITGRGRVKAGQLARNSQQLATVGRAFREYDLGTGRRSPRRTTSRRR